MSFFSAKRILMGYMHLNILIVINELVMISDVYLKMCVKKAYAISPEILCVGINNGFK